MKILLVTDSPYATTGLGRMAKYFIKMLPEHEWIVWGFLHPDYIVKGGRWYPHYNEKDFEAKVKIISPKTFTENQFGLELVPELVKAEKPDVIITSMDYDRVSSVIQPLMEAKMTTGAKWINYFPVDREDYKPKEAKAYGYADVDVCISKFGKKTIKKHNPQAKIEQIWHPIDTSEFPQISKSQINKFRAKTWKGVKSDTFVVGTVNRSFARKDTARLVYIFTEFLKQNKKTYAYIHGRQKTYEGIDLAQMAYENDIPKKRMSFLPNEISEVNALPNEVLNMIYRSMDMFVSVSTGEGFGFTTVEAMMTETPIIAPNNTSFPELIQDFGYLIPTSEKQFHYNSTRTWWGLVNIEEVVEQMNYVINNYTEAKDKAREGRRWVIDNLSLEKIAPKWKKLLLSIV